MLNQLVYHDEHVYKLWIRIEERRFGFCLSPFDLLRARSNKVRRRQLFLFLLSLSTRSLLENHDVLGFRANVCVLSSSHLSPSILPEASSNLLPLGLTRASSRATMTHERRCVAWHQEAPNERVNAKRCGHVTVSVETRDVVL